MQIRLICSLGTQCFSHFYGFSRRENKPTAPCEESSLAGSFPFPATRDGRRTRKSSAPSRPRSPFDGEHEKLTDRGCFCGRLEITIRNRQKCRIVASLSGQSRKIFLLPPICLLPETFPGFSPDIFLRSRVSDRRSHRDSECTLHLPENCPICCSLR